MSKFNEKGTIDLLKRLVETPSPFGFTEKVMQVITEELSSIGVPYERTNKGAVIATLKRERRFSASFVDGAYRYTWCDGERN